MTFWINADESVPCCGDDKPRVVLVALESGAIALGRYVEPKTSTAYWEVDSRFDVTHWAFIPDVPGIQYAPAREEAAC